jgi:mannose-6-phosphate isomerase class I
MTFPRYRTYPVHIFPELGLQAGYVALVQEIQRALSEMPSTRHILIDGFVGVEWSVVIGYLQEAFEQCGLQARWLSTEECFLPPDQIVEILAPTLTEDPVFGRIFHGRLEELWDVQRKERLQDVVAQSRELTVLYGYGASLISSEGLRLYLDVPKDRGQSLAGQQQISNVGAYEPESMGAMYKRFYFVDWPMLNRIKRALLPSLDLFIDMSESDEPIFVTGDAFRSTLQRLASRPFRVKPWFAPGPWGGQWMKEQFGLPADQPNYAWSFEVIAPENGLLLGNGDLTLECSLDYLLWWETEAVLGVSVAARYGSYLPIRLDYLDTMDGTNLSCQVHPSVDYIRNEFGEPFTQDETYYIVTCKPGSQVYLGLREDIDLARFRADAERARDQGIPFEITDHVNSLPSKQHDLFLIPSGTVHCSGANNLVLEISATPYIYTFKIYDYLRRDLRGQLRHVHLDHAFANINRSRTTQWVRQQLCPRPCLLRQGSNWAEYCIGDIDHLFFAIHRLEFTETIEDSTGGKFLLLNLVEGERCEVLSEGNEAVELRFAESLVVPACVERYWLQNRGEVACKVVKTFVK